MQSGAESPGTPSIDLRNDSSARSVPIYVLFLIMLSSGIFTLIFLWICIQYIYHRRMIRQALVDLEQMFVAERPWEGGDDAEPTEQEIAAHLHAASTALPPAAAVDAKCCDKHVELMYVVMAGEERPTFLARALDASEDDSASSSKQ